MRQDSILASACVCYGQQRTFKGKKKSVCCLQDLFVAHVGDSGAFCIRDGAARRLTIDHKPTNPAEQKRIANAGGKVLFFACKDLIPSDLHSGHFCPFLLSFA